MSINTKKLVYEDSKISVKPNDVVETTMGNVKVKNIHAPRKKSGIGRVTVVLEDGRRVDYPPSLIGAIWI